MATPMHSAQSDRLAARLAGVRALSCAIAAPLSDADATIQPMPDASPTKWHLAHTSWFFETFVLREQAANYVPFDDQYGYLFNSYYEGEGTRLARSRRGMLSRPSLAEVLDYRDHVDTALFQMLPKFSPHALSLVELGLNHEQQHQELMLMDMLAVMAENPLQPAVWVDDKASSAPTSSQPPPLKWIAGAADVYLIGHDQDGFAFDCEGPAHQILLRPWALADRLITNGEWLRFMEAGGYQRPELWLADGWVWIQDNRIGSPLYWRLDKQGWSRFGLDGLHPLNPAEPVCHIAYYEADAYARWAGARLPTEAEWEIAAQHFNPEHGNQLDQAGPVRPLGGQELFGDVWQWTQSAFLPYPGFAPGEGALGEYNGKFMCSQMVLKGASCATPRGHSRASYRNFFYPSMRWQFAGLRLAKDL